MVRRSPGQGRGTILDAMWQAFQPATSLPRFFLRIPALRGFSPRKTSESGGRELPLSLIQLPVFPFDRPNVGLGALRTTLVLSVSRLTPHRIQNPRYKETAPEGNFKFSRSLGKCLAFPDIITSRTNNLHKSSFSTKNDRSL